jgi:hypothetical protein
MSNAVSIPSAVLIVAPVPPLFHLIIGTATIPVQSAIACRVYRQIRMGLIADFLPTPGLDPPSPHSIGRSRRLMMPSLNRRALETHDLERSHRGPMYVEIMRTAKSQDFSDSTLPSKEGIKEMA